MKKFSSNLSAILQKQFKDAFNNKMMLFMFFIFPIVTFVFKLAAPVAEELPPQYFVMMFSTMFIGMVPASIMVSVISEEKEKKTLRTLMYANVSPFEYLSGIGLFTLSLATIGGLLFGFMGEFAAAEFVLYMLIFFVGAITSLLLGSVIGLIAKNQMNASAIVTPVSLVFSFMPLLAMFNDSIKTVAQIFYTYQINSLIGQLTIENFTLDKFAVLFANIIVFAVLFVLVYRKVDLSE